MSFFKFSKFSRHIRLIPSRCGYADNTKNSTFSRKSDISFKIAKNWKIIVPIGIGISVVTIWRWSHAKRQGNFAYSNVVTDTVNDLIIQCYYLLPLRATSRIFGWLAEIELPLRLRPFLYNTYAKLFNVNLDEIDCDLLLFPSLADFFVRPLKPSSRPIATNTNIVSPADGTVLYLGPVLCSKLDKVKGVTYNLQNFLGEKNLKLFEEEEKLTYDNNDHFAKLLLKNPKNSLYQLTVYLAPGDYHRFHSATDWKIKIRRHFQGELLSVNPKVVNWLPNLFEINERAVYIGDWAGGFMAYAAVGATNVGSVRVYCDNTLKTNRKNGKEEESWQELCFNSVNINKGELFGEFRLGSTIVLLFEAPKDVKFSVTEGQVIKMGEALTKSPIKCRTINISFNFKQCTAEALKFIRFKCK
ncbi:phosphatidylserine decarboxylase proenzyme, mitochondrial [Microplitis demolitor]|uniref:phosphatidylserine decarboxylase proenzyme, mitochondrial n=1 Tax=Microplitis demolitor TaxID=69319 RepID=UPI0004CCEDEF|nr:phosphatidylserine decarboxylase proenzyme, mitochondrial [Microplitis demolitor]